jgi:hypothetical protein
VLHNLPIFLLHTKSNKKKLPCVRHNSHDRKMEKATQCRKRSRKTTRFSSAFLCT